MQALLIDDWQDAHDRPRARRLLLGIDEAQLDAMLSGGAQWAVERVQFGQQIGKFQGVSFKLADMAVEIEAKVRESYGLKPVAAAPAAPEEPAKEAKEKEAHAEKERPAKAARAR